MPDSCPGCGAARKLAPSCRGLRLRIFPRAAETVQPTRWASTSDRGRTPVTGFHVCCWPQALRRSDRDRFDCARLECSCEAGIGFDDHGNTATYNVVERLAWAAGIRNQQQLDLRRTQPLAYMLFWTCEFLRRTLACGWR